MPEYDDGAVASRFAFSRPGNPLLDYGAAQVGVDKSLVCSIHSISQGFVGNSFATRKALEPRVLEDSQVILTRLRTDKVVVSYTV